MTFPVLRSLRTAFGPALLALGLASVAAPSTLAYPSRVEATHARSAQHVQRLTIHITATGDTVWGTVTVRYTYHGRVVRRSTSQAVSTIALPRGVTVHLTQQAYSTSSWPFKQWTVTEGQRSSILGASTVTLKANRNYQVTALYVLATASGGYGGYGA